MIVKLEPLTAEAFAPFGQVLTVPTAPGRDYFDDALSNLRPNAKASLSIARREDLATLPFTATQMERHEFSSQSFVPLDVGRWLVMVAPHASGGGPDMTKAKAFLPRPGQGVTFGANVWHHPMTILDKPATFAVYMWLVKGPGDEEFFTLKTPVTISL
jgi:ureidoglycolate lyase